MGQQIIQQPNGKYAVFSSVVEDFILLNATPGAIIKMRIEDEARAIREQVRKVIDTLKRGEKPYHQFTMNWEEALSWRDKVNGKKTREFSEKDFMPKGKRDKRDRRKRRHGEIPPHVAGSVLPMESRGGTGRRLEDL